MSQTTVSSSFSNSQIAETAFEKRRGINHVELRTGLTQVHVLDLDAPVSSKRIDVLKAVADAGISLDFLKLTPNGMSFLVPADKTDLISATLTKANITNQLDTERSIVLIHAVNIRDEEGTIAGILRRVIDSGISIDHASDMHDRVLIVAEDSAAAKFKAIIEEDLRG